MHKRSVEQKFSVMGTLLIEIPGAFLIIAPWRQARACAGNYFFVSFLFFSFLVFFPFDHRSVAPSARVCLVFFFLEVSCTDLVYDI